MKYSKLCVGHGVPAAFECSVRANSKRATRGGKEKTCDERGKITITGNGTRINFSFCQGIARTQSPTTINYAPESPTFGVIAEVSQTGVQW